MSTVAIIPARGGSKGVPRKNVRPLAGKPLLGWTIRAAQEAKHVDHVIVTTDDEEIATVAAEYRAEVVRRPANLSTDTALSEPALLHVLDVMEAAQRPLPEQIAFLQCTSPLTVSEDIDGTIAAMIDHDADSALAVAPFHGFLWQHRGESAIGVNHDKLRRLRRQDRTPEFVETGAVYVMHTSGFRAARHRFFGRTSLYVMPRDRWLEVDDPADFELAEFILRLRQPTDQAVLPRQLGAVVFDFDGVFTDNSVSVDQEGHESVVCHRGDGYGIERLREMGVPMLVLSREENHVVGARCRKLGIECLQNSKDKLPALRSWLENHGIDILQTVYVGNDHNDIECLRAVGCGVVVADAHPEAIAAADLVLRHPGGHGAVRELCDRVLELRKSS